MIILILEGKGTKLSYVEVNDTKYYRRLANAIFGAI